MMIIYEKYKKPIDSQLMLQMIDKSHILPVDLKQQSVRLK
ncbi:hypothetical protein EUBDOL_00855 [Amedibacillus dolichus DSM 3991]|uniref:Uncharacterized protein n=1 Tax=Amedibacillus dolichus DSM 3991 TaxID=428127 RepID=A8RAM4_9FIRM|nr:hypothetical protein EUBDOL_00855 [Amedibacillus dolichus DSM 3991]